MEDIIFAFKSYLNKELSTETISGYCYDIRLFLQFVCSRENILCSNKEGLLAALKNMRQADLYAFINSERSKTGVSAVNRKISSIKKFFDYLYSERILQENIAYGIKKLKEAEKDRSELLSREEINKLINSVGGRNMLRDKTVIALIAFAGMSVDDLLSLKVSDIGSEYITLFWDNAFKKSVAINEPLRSILSDYLFCVGTTTPSNPLFCARNNASDKLSKRTVHQLLNKYMLNCGYYIKGNTSELLRKSGAVILKNYYGADIFALKEYIGHKNILSTEKYIAK